MAIRRCAIILSVRTGPAQSKIEGRNLLLESLFNPQKMLEKIPEPCYNLTMEKQVGIRAVRKTDKKKQKIFDSVYRTIATKLPELLIPLINEVFGSRYRQDSKIE